MHRKIAIILILMNIASIQIYKYSQHERDSFTLCGKSYHEASPGADENSGMVVATLKTILGEKSNTKDQLKEFKIVYNDLYFMKFPSIDHKPNNNNKIFLTHGFLDINNPDPRKIFKPS